MITVRRLESTFGRPHPHLEVFKRVSIFSHLSDQTITELLRRTTVRRWHGGALVLGEHEAGEGLYVVVEGHVKVVLFGDNGREVTLSVLGPADFFGEMSIFDGKPRSANVVAAEDVTLLGLDREAFAAHLASSPRTAMALLRELSERLRRANSLINDLALHSVPSRLVRTLVTLAEEDGETREDGVFIRRRPTQQELANMVGTCRETVSRALSALARKGLVVSRGRSLLLSRQLLDGYQQAA